MEYINLGSTGIKVSKICIGTLEFGRRTDETLSTELVKSAFAEGVKTCPGLWTSANYKVANQLKEIAQGFGHSLARFALAWILSNKTITSAVYGVSSLAQLNENIKATDIKMSENECAACDEV